MTDEFDRDPRMHRASDSEGARADGVDDPPLAPSGRAIVLFSDGTGNSSAKLFKTNVWRMYEAVELGGTAVEAQQIVYYDEGVGNSGFRPLAVLGGVFGYGLKRNVLDLYGFLCRNYRAGDRIYLFGFSRGAFTARVLAGLIARQGLVPYRSEGDLAHQVRSAYRAYSGFRARPWPPMSVVWWLIRLLIAGVQHLLGYLPWRHRYDVRKNRDVPIRFIGVWDTVAAYGGPIIELVRAFDDWIRPLSFKDQRLSDKVEIARQALALDDERDAFQPVPWDEPVPPDRDRLKQVWFSGMHADVGGGYPDDSLAYVSLAWMMEEARDAGLVLRSEKVDEANRVANAFGPIHDSRSGLGAYYRYQPRIVGAFVQPPPSGARSIEDPQFKGQGLQPRVWVHESVLHRIAAGTDGYAPITLPQEFTVVDHSPDDVKFATSAIANLAKTAKVRADRQEQLRDRVWYRRALYFGTVAASLGLGGMPLWHQRLATQLCSDSRCVLSDVYIGFGYLLPDFAQPWIKAFSAAPSVATTLVVAILVFMKLGSSVERGLRDRSRRLWKAALRGRVGALKRASLLRAVRTSGLYQRLIGLLKWHLLPTIFGVLMMLTLIWALALALTQLRLSVGEGRGLFCGTEAVGPVLRTDDPCNDLGVTVTKGTDYHLEIRVIEPWSDGKHVASPLGLRASALRVDLPWLGWAVPVGELGAPFRRVVKASYLQPLLEIVDDQSLTAHVTVLKVEKSGPQRYRARFKASRTGRVRMFVNDAVPPWPWDPASFYNRGAGRNCGAAIVRITSSSRTMSNDVPSAAGKQVTSGKGPSGPGECYIEAGRAVAAGRS